MSVNRDQDGNLDRILEIVDQISGDRQVSLRWLRSPLKEFRNRTPEDLIQMGRVEDLIAYIDSISSGYVG